MMTINSTQLNLLRNGIPRADDDDDDDDDNTVCVSEGAYILNIIFSNFRIRI